MKILIVGYGVQGKKRKKNLQKKNFYKIYDPYLKSSTEKKIYDLDLKKFDAAYICTPDSKKFEIIKYLLNKKKHILVEKPLNLKNLDQLDILKKISKKNNVNLYTAYNHRFEQNLVKAKKILNEKKIGKIYNIYMFYGNGTARLVKKSNWKDKGSGVIDDLGSHLLDMVNFLIGIKNLKIISSTKNKFENKSWDHATVSCKDRKNSIAIIMSMSYLMWKNTFKLDVIGQKGSLHLDGLCKWGPSRICLRKRKFPSGIPYEKRSEIISKDITWKKENDFFINAIKNKNNITNINKDIFIYKILNEIKKKN